MRAAPKPTVGIFGLTGCAGDQLVLLDCEDELLTLVDRVDLRDFLMASSAVDAEARLDVALVEGAVVTAEDAARLQAIRARSRRLVALGTCAVWGGVAAMDRFVDRDALLREIYGEAGVRDDGGSVRALHEVVAVDLALPGCPVEKGELLAALASLLRGDPPVLPSYPVCTECVVRENPCRLEAGEVCCGPVTAAGCGARCPSAGLACDGCRGPSRDANLPSFVDLLVDRGHPRDEVARKVRTFAPVDLARAREVRP